MKKLFLFAAATAIFNVATAQLEGKADQPQTIKTKPVNDKAAVDTSKKAAPTYFTVDKAVAATSVKNQAMTGTCWCFSSTSLIESQCLKNNLGELDLSEMYTVRNIYVEKAKNYLL